MPVNVRKEGVDFLASGGYKWLLSPIGVGFLYVKKEHLEKITPSILGYRSDREVYDLYYRKLSLAESARRFEHGQRNFPGFAGMMESMKLLLEVGLKEIQKRVWGLSDRIVEGARELGIETNSPINARNRSGIVNLGLQNSEKLEEQLLSRGIVVSARKGIRVSPHFYNTEEEVERFLSVLEELK
jgi:selenocysteine lyase/cysteine desulfurase